MKTPSHRFNRKPHPKVNHPVLGLTRAALTPEYKAWSNMMRRCGHSFSGEKDRYAGRGIKVCERWHSFENFLADMGFRPSPELWLERIDNDGDYAPGNCRWATIVDQQRNRSNNRRITHDGRTMTQTEWCQEMGIADDVVSDRLHRGWSVADALTTPVGAMNGWERRRLAAASASKGVQS